ncbi:histone-like nucleoid-structuring protein Lsr2 [Streptomyces sp. NPDC013172]|uniref:Histone-like nucleoid-structuring protein Lsr2 n=1 Tax=Streptomyces atriruber TaxID=545121 RepID=A0ABV3C2Q3_9ACTN
MTIVAIRRLLDEIDAQGGPEAARQGRLHLPAEGINEPMNTTMHAAQAANPDQLPVGKLLAWGDAHLDPDIQDQAARARAALAGLRNRYAADQELTAITTEAQQLEKRLAELRAREAELAPAPAKKKRAPVTRDYDTRTVRAWADANGVDCPRVGQIPKRVLDAWRASLPQSA